MADERMDLFTLFEMAQIRARMTGRPFSIEPTDYKWRLTLDNDTSHSLELDEIADLLISFIREN